MGQIKNEVLKDQQANINEHNTELPSLGRREKEQIQKYAEDEEGGKRIASNAVLKSINRIKSKLNGNDFNDKKSLTENEQVEKLIRQATSQENICQTYLGWNPFL